MTVEMKTFEEIKQMILKNEELLFTDTKKFSHYYSNRPYQYWNKEYIEQLSIAIKNLKLKSTILEVCAGDGMLSKHLTDNNIKIVATDDCSWASVIQGDNVERYDAIKAIEKFKPELVIASWIPFQHSIDYQILLTKVKHFIFIGETHGGCCGSDYIWDNYKNAGYTMTELDDVDRYNLCRTDDKFHIGHSHTVLFSKKTLGEIVVTNNKDVILH